MAVLKNPTAARWDLDRGIAEIGLAPPFPRGISFGDVDAEVEINGHFLVLECKHEGEAVSRGQARTMDARVRDGRTCWIVTGAPPYCVSAVQVWPPDLPPEPMGLVAFLDLCAVWARAAQAAPRPAPRPSLWTR